VRKVGQRVVVTAELSQPLGRPSRVWGDVMDRSGADVLDVETAIAEAVASVVAGRLQPDERAAVSRRPTRDARAYDLFQQANLYLNRGMAAGAAVGGDAEADFRSAIAFYRAALQRDSGFVAAWEGLAWTWWWLAGTAPTRPALLEVRRAAERAMVLDSTAGNAMGMDAIAVAGLAYDWPAAVELARRGTRAAPRAAGPWINLSLLLDYQGRFDEAIAAGDSALARDSVDQASHWALAVPLIDSRRWEQLAGWESRWRSSDPIVATYAQTYLALHDGRPLDALRAYRALPYEDLNALVEALAAADSLSAARDLVSRARAQAETQLRDAGWVANTGGLAAAYALLGEVDTAFVWLERAYTQGNMDLLLRLKVVPSFDRLRNDPRYHDLLRRMHLEP
jgi:tetratricopeptide (TPR) repeat protein